MKAFKDWVIAHKLLSIIIAAVILVGAASAIVLPIALSHKHDFSSNGFTIVKTIGMPARAKIATK